MKRTREPLQHACAGGTDTPQRGHQTPDPETPPPDNNPPPVPDDFPDPEHAPVKEPTRPEPPIKA